MTAPTLFKTALLLTACCVIAVCGLTAQQMAPDYTGTTKNLVPSGWTVESSTDNGLYVWSAKQDKNEGSPGLMQIILPDVAGNLEEFVPQLLSEMVAELQTLRSESISANEYHCLLSGKIHGIEARLALCIVRDPDKFLFFNLFAAPLADYARLGSEELLYKSIQRANPFSSAPAPPEAAAASSSINIKDPFYYNPDGKLNMQSPQVQDYILASSKPLTPKDVAGEWMQVMSLATGNAYQDIYSGATTYGARGYAHILRLEASGRYTLSYNYENVSAGVRNSVKMTEEGAYTLSGNTLHLKRAGYSGEYNVFATRKNENVSNPPDRSFRIGLLEDKNHLVIHGPEFEYTVSSHWNDGSLKLGFHRQ